MNKPDYSIYIRLWSGFYFYFKNIRIILSINELYG